MTIFDLRPLRQQNGFGISVCEFDQGRRSREGEQQQHQQEADESNNNENNNTNDNTKQQQQDFSKLVLEALEKSIKENVEILTGAVGLITEKDQAEEVLDNHEADVIFLGRELLRNPYWTLYASGEIDEWPLQYQRSFEGSKKINYIRED